MVRLVKECVYKAKRDYHCDASDAVRELLSCGHVGYTREEFEAISDAQSKGWRIKKGEKYIYQFIVDEHDSWSIRAIPAMHDLCVKFKLFDDE